MQQQSLIEFVIGSEKILHGMEGILAKPLFSEDVLCFLDCVSKRITGSAAAREYPDVATFGFWIRKANLYKLKEKYFRERKGERCLGRGVVFHIAPSNVAVNYAYSLAAGLLCGNANIVRLPGREFPQTDIINDAFRLALKSEQGIAPYICLLKYGHERVVNDSLSALADVRVIWGGDHTIAALRESPLAPRALEVAFADRCSLSVIDSDAYMGMSGAEKKQVAQGFYNDTYLTDQNACTSPKLVVWHGALVDEAKEQFWGALHSLVIEKYQLTGAQAVGKLAASYLAASVMEGVVAEPAIDNCIVRLRVPVLSQELLRLQGNSGFFFEYTCKDVQDLQDFCMDKKIQTISYVGDPLFFEGLLRAGIRGVDRIVPVGRTMDFDLIWDGYDLVSSLSRRIVLK